MPTEVVRFLGVLLMRELHVGLGISTCELCCKFFYSSLQGALNCLIGESNPPNSFYSYHSYRKVLPRSAVFLTFLCTMGVSVFFWS